MQIRRVSIQLKIEAKRQLCFRRALSSGSTVFPKSEALDGRPGGCRLCWKDHERGRFACTSGFKGTVAY
eukprot:4981889-Prymnesium_polylepis.1